MKQEDYTNIKNDDDELLSICKHRGCADILEEHPMLLYNIKANGLGPKYIHIKLQEALILRNWLNKYLEEQIK